MAKKEELKENRLREVIGKTRRAVVKVGSSVLIQKNGRLSPAALFGIAKEIAFFQKRGIETVFVSSGAIASGMSHLGFRKKPHKLSELQACAAIGQPILMQLYQKALARSRLHAAQILLTRNDLEDPVCFLNARHTLNELLDRGVIPIINENDTVVVEEIRVGDNDNLAALVAKLAQADLLILLTDRDGLYTADPKRHARAKKMTLVEDIDKAAPLASDTDKAHSTGGMKTKLEAAKRVGELGVPTIIADGRDRKILERILSGHPVGTLIFPRKK